MIKPKKWLGKPIGMPGIYSDVPMEFYHSAKACIEPSISSSGLRTIFTQSPKHYWVHSPYNPKAIEREETDALIRGRAAHHLLFGQADFKKLFAVKPAELGGSKFHMSRLACQIWVQDREREGKTIIDEKTLADIVGMSESLAAEPLVKAGILNGMIEHSWFWKDKETGVWLKNRPDASPNDSLDFADLKSTRSVRYDDIQRTIRDYGYYQQAGLLADGCRVLLGVPMHSYSLVFIETKPPYCVSVVTLKENDIDRGIRANRLALRKFAEGMATGKWLGPAGDVSDARYVELPKYTQDAIDERLKMEGV